MPEIHNTQLSQNIARIASAFDPNQSYTLLFSGGTDSCAILGTALHAGIAIEPVWVDNGFNRATADDIRQQARRLGCNNLEIKQLSPTDMVRSNPGDRCYHCKSQILGACSASGNTMVDGTVTDDLQMYRPGARALNEFAVRSILAENNITKAQAREIALHFGADPAIAELESCLATRFNYQVEISASTLEAIRNIERYVIENTNDYKVRCRLDDADHLRIEAGSETTMAWLINEKNRKTIQHLSADIAMFATLDLRFSRPNEYDKRLKK